MLPELNIGGKLYTLDLVISKNVSCTMILRFCRLKYQDCVKVDHFTMRFVLREMKFIFGLGFATVNLLPNAKYLQKKFCFSW